jgi:methylenetetrahydrofolate dehydrogenase (NADP+) / methenyltetrahydrofolate cyclohydrolase
MSARIIDGKTIAADLRGKVTDAVHRLRRDRGLVPGLAVVLVGSNPASELYVRNKSKAVTESGMHSFDRRLPESVSEPELLDLIAELNGDARVNGILVQLPLPQQIDAQKIISAIEADKDVDGFHPLNAGRHATGLAGLVPCTPLGCVLLAKTVHPSLEGLEAVVIGRSNIVGKPVAQLLLTENVTVTIAHSKTRDLPDVCRRADLLVAAIGRPEMVRQCVSSAARRRRLYPASWRRIFPTSGRPRGRRGRDRTPSPARCRTKPRPPDFSGRCG